MKNKVNFFLEYLKSIKKSSDFLIFNDSLDAKSDTLKIFELQKNRDIEGLIDCWKATAKKPYFELLHPEKLVKTRAVYSRQHGMANFVLLVDKFNKNFWILAQCELFINIVITENNSYKNSYGNIEPIVNQLQSFTNGLEKLNLFSFNYNKSRFGFNLSQTRPYHHFYDHLKFFLAINIKPIYKSNSFFIPIKENSAVTESTVFLFPAVIGNNYISQNKNETISKLNLLMESFVYKESIAIKDSLVTISDSETDNALSLWFGITGQKRSWLQQVEGCIEIVKLLLSYFNEIKVYIDGMTAMEGESLNNEEDNAVFSEIEKTLASNKNVKITSLIGMNYREKIVICDTVDFFIANAGTGSMVPLRFVKKPGVLHSNTKMFTFPDSYQDTIKRVANNQIIDVSDGVSTAAMHTSYHVPWQHVFNLTAEVIELTKGVSLKKLDVPSVNKVKAVYESENEQEIKLKRPFLKLSEITKSAVKSPDILYIVAVSFEQSGDIQTAFKVMEKAHLLRPEGPVIKQKLEEYHQLLVKKL